MIYMNQPDLDLNNLQWLICRKTKPTNQYNHAMTLTFRHIIGIYHWIYHPDIPLRKV